MALGVDLDVSPPRSRHAIALEFRSEYVGLAAVAIALGTFALYVVPGGGGQDTNRLVVGLTTMTVAFAAQRAWRVLTARLLAVLVVISGSVAAVLLFAPTGTAGLRDAAGYAYALMTFATVLAFCSSEARRQLVVVAACLVALDQFSRGFLPWWGGEDVSRQMVGTFYAHNQFAAFVLGGGLVAGLTAVFGRRPWRTVGFVCAPFCATGVMVSASRGSILLMSAGWLAAGLVTLLQKNGRWSALGRWAVVSAASFGCVVLLTSGVVFRHGGGGSGVAAVQQHEAVESSETNTRFRIEMNRAAMTITREHPIVGAGFGSFASASAPHLPLGRTRTTYVHNGYVQAAADGGAVLALPFLLALLAGAARTLLLLGRQIRRVPEGGTRVVCGAAALVLMAHSAIDLDWSYPALFGLGAVLLAVALSRDSEPVSAPGRGRATGLLAGVLVVAAILAVVGSHQWETVNALIRGGADRSADPVHRLVTSRTRVLSDPRIEVAIIRRAVPANYTGTVVGSQESVREAVRRTARLVDVDLQMQRAQALAAIGRREQGMALAARIVQRYGDARPYLIGEYAEMQAAFGSKAEARTMLDSAIATRTNDQFASGGQLLALTRTLQALFPEDERMLCTVQAVRASLERFPALDGQLVANPPAGGCVAPNN
jgi:hypothetical protein